MPRLLAMSSKMYVAMARGVRCSKTRVGGNARPVSARSRADTCRAFVSSMMPASTSGVVGSMRSEGARATSLVIMSTASSIFSRGVCCDRLGALGPAIFQARWGYDALRARSSKHSSLCVAMLAVMRQERRAGGSLATEPKYSKCALHGIEVLRCNLCEACDGCAQV